jgi:hypothetical protein
MNLTNLINILESIQQDKLVVFDFGDVTPSGFASWRGDYSLPSISYEVNSKDITVEKLLALAKEFSGSTVAGYKGGEFLMNPNDNIWVAHYGRSGHTALSDITEEGYRVVLHTKYSEY